MSLLGGLLGNKLYNRVAKLTVTSQLLKIGKEFKSDTVDILTGETTAGFRFVFKVVKNSESFPNSATIQIYNLNDLSRSLFTQKDARVTLVAGYQGSEEQIFVGDVSKSSTKSVGNDSVTEIEAGDGLKAFQETRVDKSYSPGTTTIQVLGDMMKEFSFDKKDISGVRAGTFLNGLSLSGPARNHMNMLCDKMGAEWSVQDNGLQVIKKDSYAIDTAVNLTSDTGLIGSPVKKDQGVEFTSLLQPKIYPGRMCVILAKFLKGTYRCMSVTHTGDTRGREWYSHVEAL